MKTEARVRHMGLGETETQVIDEVTKIPRHAPQPKPQFPGRGMKRFQAFMEKSYPDGDRMSGLTTYGQSTAELLVHVLKQCGDDLTRENVMRHAAGIKNFAGDLALPGMAISTAPTDYRVNKQFQMMRVSGEQWELFGSILSDDLSN